MESTASWSETVHRCVHFGRVGKQMVGRAAELLFLRRLAQMQVDGQADGGVHRGGGLLFGVHQRLVLHLLHAAHGEAVADAGERLRLDAKTGELAGLQAASCQPVAASSELTPGR